MSKSYTINVYERPSALQRPGEFWQADSGMHHAVGDTPGQAVDRLIRHIERNNEYSRILHG